MMSVTVYLSYAYGRGHTTHSTVCTQSIVVKLGLYVRFNLEARARLSPQSLKRTCFVALCSTYTYCTGAVRGAAPRPARAS